jgi:hypothetical protein
MDAPQLGHFLTDEWLNGSASFYGILHWKFCPTNLRDP